MNDTTPTARFSRQKRRLWGWLSYAFASEVFAVCSLTLFLPVCLEQYARDQGFLLPDRTEPCSGTVVPVHDLSNTTAEARCAVKIGWLWVDSASFSLYVFSASVAIQALTVISMGGIADHPPHRKLLLLFFAALGSISATLFLLVPSTSSVWLLCALFAILANVSFGASIVALNAYLPSLARGAPEVVEARAKAEQIRMETDDSEGDAAGESQEYLEALEKYHQTLSRTTSSISSKGIAIGYASGIALLLVALIPVTKLKGSTMSLRIAIGMSGLWWGLFTIPAAVWLPGGPHWGLNHSKHNGVNETEDASSGAEDTDDRGWRLGSAIIGSWKRLGSMLRPSEIKRLKNTFWFLAAWFLLSDGFVTITSTAVLFAKTTLHMTPSSLILIGVLTPMAGILGSLLWPWLQRRLGWSNLSALVSLILFAAVIPLYGCLGFLPFFGKHGTIKFGGLTSPAEMFVLALYFGSLYGAFQSYARSVFSELIPPGEEARWYGLYSITDKSSSFLGPLVVGIIADATGNIRYAFFFLVGMLTLPVPILLFNVDVNKGREDALAYTRANQIKDLNGRERTEESERLVR